MESPPQTTYPAAHYCVLVGDIAGGLVKPGSTVRIVGIVTAMNRKLLTVQDENNAVIVDVSLVSGSYRIDENYMFIGQILTFCGPEQEVGAIIFEHKANMPPQSPSIIL